jgi:hypothetical protein
VDLGSSLLSWPVPAVENLNRANGDVNSLRVSMQSSLEVVGFKLSCLAPENVQLSIQSLPGTTPMKFDFYALLQSGSYSIKPSIFPISSLLLGSFDLKLVNSGFRFT